MTEDKRREEIISLMVERIHMEYLKFTPSMDDAFDIKALEEKIEETLGLFFPNDDDVDEYVKNKIKKKLQIKITIQAKPINILTDPQNIREPWYTDDFRSRKNDFYWNRFKESNEKSGYPKAVLQRLEESSQDIVEQLGNPELPQFKIKGMVMGNVQSGKTLSYTAVINKAVDAGYKSIILLTGMTESLRSQTQQRINHDVVGQAYSEIEDSERNVINIGVGLINSEFKFSNVLTTVKTDFNQMKKIGIVNFDPSMQPSIMVVKKNVKVLESVNKFLNDQDISKFPVLLIDDEADNASVDTSKKDRDEDPKAINREIRKMLNFCRRITYLAYTATPMANFFIAEDIDAEMQDLFPSDFLVSLEAPSNYCGGDWFFTNEEKDEEPLVIIEDIEGHIPAKHKKELEPASLPDSLIDAIKYFMIVSAIKDIRRSNGELESKSLDQKFDVCMVNVTVFSDVQNNIRYTLKYDVNKIHEAIKANGALQNSNDETLKSLEKIFNERVREDTIDTEPLLWKTILEQLIKMDKVVVVATNANSPDGDLDWSENAPRKQIVVGGFMLSRGLTLPGLTVSYYARYSIMYDTLMQMARWYGYRDGYKDLVKLWAPSRSIENFTIVTRALAELTDSIRFMKRNGNFGPKEFGLRVRTHPDLLVTSKLKSQGAIRLLLEQSFQGMHLQTWGFFQDTQKEKAKEKNILKFLTKLKSKIDKDDKGHIIFKDIPFKDVDNLLNDISIHPINSHLGEIDQDPSFECAFMRYIRKYKETNFKNWDIAIFRKIGVKNSITEVDEIFGEKVPYELRGIGGDQSTPRDCILLSQNRNISAPGIKNVGMYSSQERKNPILVFHFLQAYIDKNKKKPHEKFLKFDGSKYIGLSIMLPNSKKNDDKVEYQVTEAYWNNHYKPKLNEFTEEGY